MASKKSQKKRIRRIINWESLFAEEPRDIVIPHLTNIARDGQRQDQQLKAKDGASPNWQNGKVEKVAAPGYEPQKEKDIKININIDTGNRQISIPRINSKGTTKTNLKIQIVTEYLAALEI